MKYPGTIEPNLRHLRRHTDFTRAMGVISALFGGLKNASLENK